MQRAARLKYEGDSYRIGRLFSACAGRDQGSGLFDAVGVERVEYLGSEFFYLYSPDWNEIGITISASEFRHICLLFGEINTHGLPKELTWNA